MRRCDRRNGRALRRHGRGPGGRRSLRLRHRKKPREGRRAPATDQGDRWRRGIPGLHVSSKDELEGLRDAILADRPGVDVLVNGAGINSPTPFLDITEEEFDQILSVNLKAILLSCQVFGQAMLDRNEGGSIINLGSISGLNPLSRVFSYSASKGAVHNLSKNLAREWAPNNIRVNILVPGFFPPSKTARCSPQTEWNRS